MFFLLPLEPVAGHPTRFANLVGIIWHTPELMTGIEQQFTMFTSPSHSSCMIPPMRCDFKSIIYHWAYCHSTPPKLDSWRSMKIIIKVPPHSKTKTGEYSQALVNCSSRHRCSTTGYLCWDRTQCRLCFLCRYHRLPQVRLLLAQHAYRLNLGMAGLE